MSTAGLDGLEVAIVHERFSEVGGSERVVEQLHRLWPAATVHAAVIDRDAVPPGLAAALLQPSPLQGLYRGGRSYAYLLPLLPAAMARLDTGPVVCSHTPSPTGSEPGAGDASQRDRWP